MTITNADMILIIVICLLIGFACGYTFRKLGEEE